MQVTPAQMNMLKKLEKPFKEQTKRHPADAYHTRTLGALLTKGLVEKYHDKLFLHGAVRLTEAGRRFVEESRKTKKEKYWYAYTLRGCSPGCQPKDFIETDETQGRFGRVAYARRLTIDEVKQYELQEIES